MCGHVGVRVWFIILCALQNFLEMSVIFVFKGFEVIPWLTVVWLMDFAGLS